MKTKSQALVLLTAVLMVGSTSAFSAQTASQKVGEFNDSQAAQKKTATSQMRGTSSDVEITRKIRDRITDDESLSMNAQNITIVTLGSGITLKGNVASQAEASRVLSIAKEFAGGKAINSQLKIEKE